MSWRARSIRAFAVHEVGKVVVAALAQYCGYLGSWAAQTRGEGGVW
jgi:hypothetical protein